MCSPNHWLAPLACCAVATVAATNVVCALDLALPTDNTALLQRQPQDFFMGVDRDGKRVWEGGMFGFVRSPLHWAGGTVFTQFHEGIDIAPVHRNTVGIPTDEVRAVSAGIVVLCEAQGPSQYGNQVVLRHDWGEGPVFSRYAHLQSVTVKVGDAIAAGGVVGVIGYTGGALTMERAHLHLEIDLMLNEAFESSWLPNQPRAVGNPKFHPANMSKLDAAALLLAAHNSSNLTLAEFVTRQTAYFSVAVAAPSAVDLLRRHPWLAGGRTSAPAWRISFTETGFPMRFEGLEKPPTAIGLVWVQPYEGKHAWRTGGLLSGSGQTGVLTPRGEALIQFLLRQ